MIEGWNLWNKWFEILHLYIILDNYVEYTLALNRLVFFPSVSRSQIMSTVIHSEKGQGENLLLK